MPAPYWKGYLKLSLVTCAVAMSPATSKSERISFHNLNKKTGNRLRIELVDEVTRRPIEREDIVKGYPVGENEFVRLTDEELDDVALESTHTIEITAFVPREEVDVRYLDQPYYLAPDDEVAAEPFAVIRDAMLDSGQAGIGQLVLGDRERIVMLEARGKGILVWRLKYDYEVKSADAVFERVEEDKPDKAAVAAMKEFIEAKRDTFKPEAFRDPLQEAHREIIEAKQKHRSPPRIAIGPAAAAQSGSNVTSIFEQLRRSVAAEKKAPRAAVAAARSRAGTSRTGKAR